MGDSHLSLRYRLQTGPVGLSVSCLMYSRDEVIGEGEENMNKDDQFLATDQRNQKKWRGARKYMFNARLRILTAVLIVIKVF